MSFFHFTTYCILFFSSVVVAEDIQQDFLFLLEEAYTQESGEWQFSLDFKRYNHYLEKKSETKLSKQHTTILAFNTEYGITDRLQVELSIPYQKISYISDTSPDSEILNYSGVGNTEISVGYQVFQESDTLPSVTLEFGVEIPASNEKEPIRSDAWAYESAINMSKYIASLGFIHASFSYGVGEHGDEKEWAYGAAIVRPLNDNWSGHLEYLYETEKELMGNEEETETLGTISIGLSYQNEQGFIAGVAYEKGNDKTIKNNVLNLKIQYEF